MVHENVLERTFAALADTARRDILVRLVDVLVDAGLVTTEKVGRPRQCRLGPTPEVRDFFASQA